VDCEAGPPWFDSLSTHPPLTWCSPALRVSAGKSGGGGGEWEVSSVQNIVVLSRQEHILFPLTLRRTHSSDTRPHQFPLISWHRRDGTVGRHGCCRYSLCSHCSARRRPCTSTSTAPRLNVSMKNCPRTRWSSVGDDCAEIYV